MGKQHDAGEFQFEEPLYVKLFKEELRRKLDTLEAEIRDIRVDLENSL